ncbi:AAA family ATPase, partial [Marinobacter alexandrii]|uniref:AAA family ATPase n=1 Tax=Marinobacter alexandrii TaxID=2570351 RepID=UPI003297CA5B
SFSADRENLIGIRSLFHIARDHGWRDAAPGFQPPITILSPDDCREIPHAGYVIKGIIAPQNLVCIFGKPGAGKSVLAPHLAYAVAQGRDVFGLRVRSGGVLYVPAEDVSGMKQRIKALRENHGPAEQFGLVDGISDLFNHDSGHLQYLKAAIEERKPSLVVIDTLAAAFPGLQENDSADMGRVVGTARSICELGPAVVLVHHDVKNGGNTPRGHSILNGALESSMRLERSSTGIIKGKLEKNKNGSQDIELCFQIYGKDLGLDDDGDKITAPCAREVEGSDPDLLMGLSRSAHAVLRAFKTIEALEEEASRSELLEQAMADPNISESTDPANRRKNASRGLKVLLDRGILYQLKNDIIVDGTKHDGFDA